MSLSGPERKPKSGGKASQLVVILHGWGADGANLIDLADEWAGALPDAHFCAPNGPDVCEVNPYGYQWFSLMDRNPEKMLNGTRRAADILNQFIDAKLAELSLGAEQLALVGFSQGTMLSLHVATRRQPQLACVVGFSGALIGAEVLASEVVSRPPVCLIHGQSDEVVPFAAMGHAKVALTHNDVLVETHSRPMLGHGIDLQGMEIARQFLMAHLVESTPAVKAAR